MLAAIEVLLFFNFYNFMISIRIFEVRCVVSADESEESFLGTKSNETKFSWLISADNIFESHIKGYEKFARFFYFDFLITRFSLFDKMKLSDSAIRAEDIKVYLEPSRFCASIQGCLASGRKISKVIMEKVKEKSGSVESVEKIECEECYVQSFFRTKDVASFTFRCLKYSDSYQDFGVDGKKQGKAAVKLDLNTWQAS